MLRDKQDFKVSTIGIAVIALIACQVAVAPAAIVDDDFESYANDAAFKASAWTFTDPGSITLNTDGTHQSPIGDVGDSNGVNLRNQTAADTPRLNRTVATTAGDPFYIQFDFNSVSQNGNSGFQVWSGATLGVNLHMVGFNVDKPQVNEGSGFGNLDATIVEDAWYRYTLTIHPVNTASDTFDLRIQTLENGSLDKTFSNLGFQNNVAAALNLIRFHFNTGPNSQAGQYRIDNVLVTTDPNELNFAVIPEPQSFVLLLSGLFGIGSVALLLRSRHVHAAPEGSR